MTWLLLATMALADDPAPPPAEPAPPASEPAPPAPAPPPPAPPPGPAPAASPPSASPHPLGERPVYPPGFLPAREHITSPALMPQKYRTIPRGKYPCKVGIHVDRTGKVTDIDNLACDKDAFWALATAIVQWKFDPAARDGQPVDSVLEYTNIFEVADLLPRKHIVGFVGGAVSAGGAGWFGVEGRIHLGETLALSAGVDLDHDRLDATFDDVWVPTVRADVAISSRRRPGDFAKRGIFGVALGGFGDPYGAVGMYFAARGELMSPIPGLSIGGDAGVAFMFSDALTVDDVGFWTRAGTNPLFPWLRLSVIYYLPLPRDQFKVVAREQDPFVFEPIIPPPEPLPDLDGQPFPGVRSVHWSEVPPAVGENVVAGPGFALYPPGHYACNVRALIAEDGQPAAVRVEHCPKVGKEDARSTVKEWRWLPRPGKGEIQSVFPAPIDVRRDDAFVVPAIDVKLLNGDNATPLPHRTKMPAVYVHDLIFPDWGSSTRPSSSCFVDVDLDETGRVIRRKWVGGDIEVQNRVWEALDQWSFFPVPVDGELTATRVRLSMCEG